MKLGTKLENKGCIRELPHSSAHTHTHIYTYIRTLAAHYQHCITEEEKAISGLEKRIKEAESKISTQRKDMGG